MGVGLKGEDSDRCVMWRKRVFAQSGRSARAMSFVCSRATCHLAARLSDATWAVTVMRELSDQSYLYFSSPRRKSYIFNPLREASLIDSQRSVEPRLYFDHAWSKPERK